MWSVWAPAGRRRRQAGCHGADAPQFGLVHSVKVSPDGLVYVADSQIVIFERRALRQVGSFGTRGAGRGEFDTRHHVAADSHGHLYTAEIGRNRRAQRLPVK